MKRIVHVAWLLVVLTVLAGGSLRAAPPEPGGGTAFMAIALHDVVDTRAQLDDDGITSDQLVVLLEWLSGNGWTAISLDDVERARRGIAPLPPKAVLITVDDGLSSLYTRVYPLAVAYRMPVVAAVVGEWMDVPAGGHVRYGERTLPRSAFIDWAQAREMQASGWVEFASHSNALHTVVQANPQGNLLPAGQNRIYSGDYESDDAFRTRIRADLMRSRERMRAELGREPRAIVWPYGRYNADALAMARDVGFAFAMTLAPGPADAFRPFAIARFLPTGDPDLSTWVANLRLHDPWPSARRIVAIDPAHVFGNDAAGTDAALGRLIEHVVALGATHVMLDAAVVSEDGRLQGTWFPNAQLPMRADLLGRLAAQLRARAGVDVILRLPHRAVLRGTGGDGPRALAVYRDLAIHVPFEGLVLEDVPALGNAIAQAGDQPWHVARRRESERFAAWPEADATALRAFLEADRMRPGLQAYWLATAGHPLDRPSALAEVTLVPRTLDAHGDGAAPPSALARRIGLFLRMPDAAPRSASALAQAARAFQIDGGTVIAWGPDAAFATPASAQAMAQALAPVVSARRFPRTWDAP